MTLALNRSRFLADTVATAGPQQILTMLYDRLVLDLNRAEHAQRQGQRARGTEHLGHAQDVVAGLASTLDVDAWSGGTGLMELYLYLLREMVGAAVDGDPEHTARCTALVTPLRDAWHEAAASLATSAGPVIPTQRSRAAFGETELGGELGIG